MQHSVILTFVFFFFFLILFLSISEECSEFEESPGSLMPSEISSNGATDDSGSLWSSLGPSAIPPTVGMSNVSSCQGPGGLGSGVSYQDPLRRCNQRKKSDMWFLGCASLLASVALGQDLLQQGKLQVGPKTEQGENVPHLFSLICDIVKCPSAGGWIFI